MSGVQDNCYSQIATAYCHYNAGIMLQMFTYIIASQYHGRYVLASNKKDDFEICVILILFKEKIFHFSSTHRIA
jgi:hypothetical protein